MFQLLQIVDSTAKNVAQAPVIQDHINLLDLLMKGYYLLIEDLFYL